MAREKGVWGLGGGKQRGIMGIAVIVSTIKIKKNELIKKKENSILREWQMKTQHIKTYEIHQK